MNPRVHQFVSPSLRKSLPGWALLAFLLCAGALAGSLGASEAAVTNDYRLSPLPENISTYGGDVDSLYFLILWITGVTFVITEALLVWVLLRYRHRDGHKSDYVHGNHKLEIVWTIVPGLIVMFLAIYQLGTWKLIKMDNLQDDKDTLHVQVLAKQFEWNFRYAGPDGKFETDDDVCTIRNLVIPANRRVVVEMRSTDVIHSLFLPYFRFKQDLMPGMTVKGWFIATKTTEKAREERHDPGFNYEIACAELCGPQHGAMRADVVIKSNEEFNKWLVDKSKKDIDTEKPQVWHSDETKLGWYTATARGVIPEAPKHEHEAVEAHP